MRITYITQSYPPMISGAAIVVERLAQGMAERGHPTLVLAASDKGQAYIEVTDNLRIVRLDSFPNPKRANQNYASLSFHIIANEFKSFEPDILHIHDMLYLGIEGIYIAHSMKIPVIGTVHQLPWFINAYLPDYPMLKESIEGSLWAYSRWLSKQCDAMVVPTQTIAQTIQSEAGLKTLVISNGVDLSHFSPHPLHTDEKERLCRKYNLDPKKPIILHVGRLDVDKNIEVVIYAAEKTLELTNAQLFVVGDGECKNSLQNLANGLGISEHCHFPGFISANGDLPGIYRMADVFTTMSEIETQGLVLLEALASGLPVVAAEATCIPELVKNGVNGFLIPPDDVDVLAKRLTQLISNPAFAKEMGSAGRELVKTHAIQYSLDKHENLYKKYVLQRQYSGERRISKSWTSGQHFRRLLNQVKVSGKFT